MVSSIRRHFGLASRHQMAFSQPTQAGYALASAYQGLDSCCLVAKTDTINDY